jgi:transglutaminase-like putative cysteine protease
MPVYTIQHITSYEYDAPVIDSINQIKIYPIQSTDQQVLAHEVIITDNPIVTMHTDYWGNKTGVFTITEPHKKMIIESRLTVQTDTFRPPDLEKLPILLQCDYTIPDQIESTSAIADILSKVPISMPTQSQSQGSGMQSQSSFSQSSNDKKWTIADFCNRYIFENFTYEKGITTVETTVDEILKYKKGVCQDFAHLLLQLLRTANIPSRYVSGYICPNKNGLRGVGATHAWVEIWLEGKGWLGLDPTNNLWVTNSHVRLAVGRSFDDCSPAKGTFRGLANQRLSVFVSIGYEDGNKFEDQNQVNLHQEKSVVPVFVPRIHHAQQQQ